MIRKILTGLLLFYAATCVSQQNILDNYIKTGIESNLALKQKKNSYRKSLAALKHAKSLFFPNVSLQARYTIAEGGRTFDIPVGDMLNPVYATLNQITAQMKEIGMTDKVFPPTQIENEQFNFYREKEQETKLQLKQPIFNTDIYYNYKIKNELVEAEKADLQTVKRQIIADIKTGYFNYLKASQMVELLMQTKKLVSENLRVNQKLYENEKITKDNVYRAEAELSKLEQKIIVAKKNQKMAKAYFNFLLNRDLESEIEKIDAGTLESIIPGVETAQDKALENREELQQIQNYSSAMQYNVKRNRYKKAPTIAAAIDYGFQGTEYQFDGESDFVLASIVLKWELFCGFQRKADLQMAKIDAEKSRLNYEEARQQIKLQVIDAVFSLEAAQKAIATAKKQSQSAKQAFELIEKKYKLGQAPLIEYIDARTAKTNAEQNVIITLYDFYIKHAEFERITGSYPLSE